MWPQRCDRLCLPQTFLLDLSKKITKRIIINPSVNCVYPFIFGVHICPWANMYVTLSASVDNLCMLSKFSVVTVCVSLKDTHRAVVLAKLLYASPAWWGFASTADKQRIEALVRRGVRSARPVWRWWPHCHSTRWRRRRKSVQEHHVQSTSCLATVNPSRPQQSQLQSSTSTA